MVPRNHEPVFGVKADCHYLSSVLSQSVKAFSFIQLPDSDCLIVTARRQKLLTISLAPGQGVYLWFMTWEFKLTKFAWRGPNLKIKRDYYFNKRIFRTSCQIGPRRIVAHACNRSFMGFYRSLMMVQIDDPEGDVVIEIASDKFDIGSPIQKADFWIVVEESEYFSLFLPQLLLVRFKLTIIHLSNPAVAKRVESVFHLATFTQSLWSLMTLKSWPYWSHILI